MDILASEHGLRRQRNGKRSWIAGAEDIEGEHSIGFISSVSAERECGKWALNIFVGNGDPREALQAQGYQVLTVDPDEAKQADIWIPVGK